jgi:hypothetical protein
MIMDWKKVSFESWFGNFSKKTIPSEIVPLSLEFIKYLNEDGVNLPSFLNSKNSNFEEIEYKEIQKSIQKSIKNYGEVFVKLNWSSPRVKKKIFKHFFQDAAWIIFANEVKCKTLEDVFLLLKSSDLISSDLEKSKETEIEPILVLKKFYDLKPEMEFRCFIHNNELKCVSQRNCSTYYEHLVEKKMEIQEKIVNFWTNEIKEKFDLKNCNSLKN